LTEDEESGSFDPSLMDKLYLSVEERGPLVPRHHFSADAVSNPSRNVARLFGPTLYVELFSRYSFATKYNSHVLTLVFLGCPLQRPDLGFRKCYWVFSVFTFWFFARLSQPMYASFNEHIVTEVEER
jgi:hypothetical protein